MRKGFSSACFVKVNHLLLSKSYENTSGELTFCRDETTLNKASGIDKLSPRMLKLAAPIIASSIARLVNYSFKIRPSFLDAGRLRKTLLYSKEGTRWT